PSRERCCRQSSGGKLMLPHKCGVPAAERNAAFTRQRIPLLLAPSDSDFLVRLLNRTSGSNESIEILSTAKPSGCCLRSRPPFKPGTHPGSSRRVRLHCLTYAQRSRPKVPPRSTRWSGQDSTHRLIN